MIDFSVLESALEVAPEFESPAPNAAISAEPDNHPIEPDENPFLGSDTEYIPSGSESPVFKLPEIVDSATFTATELPDPPMLIDGLVHQGTKIIVGGGSKSFKTWVQLHAAIAVAYGQDWLGHKCARGRVLFVNFEIQPSFFQKRVLKICESLGITQEPGWLDVWNLRGFAAPYGLIIPHIIERIKKSGYALIVLDPIYKMYGSANENDASEVAQLLNALEKVCVETHAAVMFGAHYSKGNQSQKESIDRISGSGVFARDPDSIIPFTKHKDEGSFVIEPTLRNLPPVEPFVVTWNFPVFEVNHNLDPLELKAAGGRPEGVSAEDVLGVLPEQGLTLQNWQEKACQNLKILPSTFSRKKRELKEADLVMFSRINEHWKPLRKH